MREPAHVGLEERAQVVHAVFQHGDAVDAQAPGEALVLRRVEPAVSQHIRVHHAAAENLQPILAFAETDFALVAPALDVDFQRRLGEREERRAEAHLHAVDLEERLAEFFQDPFQVAEMRALVDHQALDLVEHRRVGLIRVAAIGAARADHADRRLLRQHGAYLHRRGVRAQQEPRAVGLGREIERVVHLPRRMAFREIQLGEVVIVGFDVGTFRHREAHVGENGGELVGHLADRMQAAGLSRRFAHRQRNVHRFGVEPGIERGGTKRVLGCRDGGGDAILQPVDRRALHLALVWRHGAERLEQRRDLPALAERRHARRFEPRFVLGRSDGDK